MNNLKLILDGIIQGDKNGGPTELAKILSCSLISCKKFDKNDLIDRYYHWWQSDAFDTGPTFMMVFQKFSEGHSIEDSVMMVNKKLKGATAGCGPVHRIAPLAAFSHIKTENLVQHAKEESKITHQHPDAGNCSAIMVLLCRYLLEGASWNYAKELISQNDEIKDTWRGIQNASLNRGGYVLDVMHSAIKFLDDQKSLKDALTFAGPSNYCPVIVGIIENIRSNYANKK